jgi:hypothetical protein
MSELVVVYDNMDTMGRQSVQQAEFLVFSMSNRLSYPFNDLLTITANGPEETTKIVGEMRQSGRNQPRSALVRPEQTFFGTNFVNQKTCVTRVNC